MQLWQEVLNVEFDTAHGCNVDIRMSSDTT